MRPLGRIAVSDEAFFELEISVVLAVLWPPEWER